MKCKAEDALISEWRQRLTRYQAVTKYHFTPFRLNLLDPPALFNLYYTV